MGFHMPAARRTAIVPPSDPPTPTQIPEAWQETPNSSAYAPNVGVGVICHAPSCSVNARVVGLGGLSLAPTATHV
jgi:hypothetical protein